MSATFGIPQPDGFIIRPRSDGLAIGAEGNAFHPVTLPCEGAALILATFGLPQLNGGP